MPRIDLHTHSVASRDGSLTERHYKKMLGTGLDFIAVTDHNTIHFAKKLAKTLGNQIIVGEEIDTDAGDIIGLYLKNDIPAGLSLKEAVAAIKAQNGLVYIPHPLETLRQGLTIEDLDSVAEHIDIIEGYNGRTVFENKTKEVLDWAAKNNKPVAASSDFHGWRGWGRTHSIIKDAPTRQNLLQQLANAEYQVGWPGIAGMLYPKFNRLRKKLVNVA